MTYPLSVKLASARQIIKGRGDLAQYANIFKVADKAKARRIIESYRDVIFDRKTAGIDAMDALTPETSIHDVSVHLESLAGASDVEKSRATMYAVMLNKASYGVDPEIRQRFADALASLKTETPPQKVLLADAERLGNPLVTAHAEAVAALADKFAAHKAERAEFAEMYRVVSDEIGKPVDSTRTALDVVTNAARARGVTGKELESDPEYLAAEVAHQAAWARYKEQRALLWAEQDAFDARENALNEEQAAIGAKFIANLAEQSPIDAAAANQWAESIAIDKSTAKKLENQGYPVERLRKDIAEFYRLSGGKVPKISLVSRRGKRAAAGGVSDMHGSGQVMVAERFDKRTLFHEMAHHLENDPVAKQIAGTFLDVRRKSGATVSLRKLTGNPGFSSDEVAYEDGFISPYVGKYYPDGTTEVFSMGMELLSDPEKLADAMARDPHHVAVVLGYTLSPNDKLFASFKASIERADEAADEFLQEQANVETDYLKIIDKLIPIDKAAPEMWLDDWTRKDWRIGKYYGKIFDYYLYDANVARWKTGKKRQTKEKVLIQPNDGGGFDMHNLNEDCDIAKAKAHAYALTKQHGKPVNLKQIAEELQNAK